MQEQLSGEGSGVAFRCPLSLLRIFRTPTRAEFAGTTVSEDRVSMWLTSPAEGVGREASHSQTLRDYGWAPTVCCWSETSLPTDSQRWKWLEHLASGPPGAPPLAWPDFSWVLSLSSCHLQSLRAPPPPPTVHHQDNPVSPFVFMGCMARDSKTKEFGKPPPRGLSWEENLLGERCCCPWSPSVT